MIPADTDTARLALACLDLTSLNDDDEGSAVAALCARAVTAHGAVAAVCVWPRFVARARATLPASVRVAAVANFPHGALDTAAALSDGHTIADSGGDEIDLVLPWRAWSQGLHTECAALVAAVRRAHPTLTLKLIVESGELRDDALITSASRMALDEGVDFLKTSTGKTPISATPIAARTILSVMTAHPRHGQIGFKASGGIRSVADAAGYIALVREALGDVTPQNFRIGASSLLTDILATLDGASAPQAPSASSY